MWFIYLVAMAIIGQGIYWYCAFKASVRNRIERDAPAIPKITMNCNLEYIEYEQEEDGRWIADLPTISGALAYGNSKEEAAEKVRKIVSDIIEEHSQQQRIAIKGAPYVNRW